MKTNHIKKLLMMILIIITIFSLSSTTIYAGDVVSKADEFLQDGQSVQSPIPESTMKTMSDMVYNILIVVAIVIAVIWGLVIGIQYITGSVSEKIKVKEGLIPYVVGCVVVFGSFTIWKIVVELLSTNI